MNTTQFMKALSLVTALSTLAALTACGGGGSSTDNTTAESTPSVSAKPGLQLSTQSLLVSAEAGEAPSVQTIDGVVNGATAPVYVFVQHTANGLSSVKFTQTSDNGGQLTAYFQAPTGLQPGRHSDTIRLDVCYDSSCAKPVLGSPKSISVNFDVRAAAPKPAIVLSATAVSFAKVPSGQRLSQQITVEETGANPMGWAATVPATATWLHVTTSGTSGGTLLLEASPDGLSPGFYATVVTVKSNNPANTLPASVRVGLYVSDKASATAFQTPLGRNVLVDPARPAVYSIKDNTLVMDHLYTGQPLHSAIVSGATLGDMAISRDGAHIVVVDTSKTKMWLYDTDTGLFRSGFIALPPSLGEYEERRTPVILTVNGHDVAVIMGLSPSASYSGYFMVDLRTGTPLTQLFPIAATANDTLAVAQDGRHFMVYNKLSPNSFQWAQLFENSKGRLGLLNISGGRLDTATDYLRTDYFVGESGTEALSCQGVIAPSPILGGTSHFDRTLLDAWIWTTPPPNFADERLKKECSAIEPYEGGQLFMTDYNTNEFQVRKRDGSLVSQWMNTGGISQAGGVLKLSSDSLRVFDAKTMMDLPR